MVERVHLRYIVNGMEAQIDEVRAYYNKKTGKVIFISEEDINSSYSDEKLNRFPVWQHDIMQITKDSDIVKEYIALPTKDEIYEYQIMEKYALSLKDKDLSKALFSTIQGVGSLKRFKSLIYHYGLEDDWYHFREKKFKELATKWCEKNNIEYIDE